MSGRDDHGHEMPAPPSPLLDDETIEALIAGADVPESARPVASLVAAVRAAGDGPPPLPSAELAVALTRGEVGHRSGARSRPGAAATRDAARHRSPAAARRRSVLARGARVGVAMKVAAGILVGAAGVVGASALDVVPGEPGDELRKAVNAVTPLELPAEEPAPSDTPIGGEPPTSVPATSGGDGRTGQNDRPGDRDADDSGGRDRDDSGERRTRTGEPHDDRSTSDDDSDDDDDGDRTDDPAGSVPGPIDGAVPDDDGSDRDTEPDDDSDGAPSPAGATRPGHRIG